MKKLLFLTLTIAASSVSGVSHAQGLGLNTDGSKADTSALLDLKSTSKGMLIPRMTQAERDLIPSPATALLIYQSNNTPGFYYNSGTPSAPYWTLISGGSNVTTQGNSFNGNGQLVQLNGSGQLPVLSGSNLTGLSADNIASGTLNAARLPSSATTQGNSFNGSSQLVQLNASGQLPALNGGNLTGLSADNIASGTLNASRLPSSATNQGNSFNGNSQLVQLNASGQLPALNGANLTNLPAGNLTGSMPAISGASLTSINADNISSGTLSASRLPSSATTQGNTFNGNSQLVQLNASGQLPAVSGAGLTNLPAGNLTGILPAISGANLTSLNATNISSGTLNAARLPATATNQGNTFNGASQLVQLNASSQLPAVSGANLTNLPAGNLTGTLPAISGANLTNMPTDGLIFLQTTNSSAATYWYGLPVGTSNTSGAANVAFICPKKITFTTMYISATENSGQPTGFTYSYTLMVNGANTGMSCSLTMVPGATVTATSSTAVTVNAGDTIAFVTSTSQGGTTPIATVRTSLGY